MPPYITVGFLNIVANAVDNNKGSFTQDDLEGLLAFVYDSERLASMVLNRYPQTPFINSFEKTILEAVHAHFYGLHHVAIGGLIPVIEGSGKQIAKARGLDETKPVKEVFKDLANFTKSDVINRKIGATNEIVEMIESFLGFIEDYFFVKSQSYPLLDRTNRHGIAHGAFSDADYGRPLNFYKTIAAVDFLTFISSLGTNYISGFVPDPTNESKGLSLRLKKAQAFGVTNFKT